ncbi:MAG: diaminopimelate epimerase [Desulfuromonadales bacterium]|nr:diaminopimelate epimerase [Desulfuromonadales bacterium]
MKFVKMHGAGNDYVYIDCFRQKVEDPERLAREISDRNFGVGGDGMILIEPSKKGDVKMRIFNADGSEAEMCGNGVRCVAKYAFDHGLVDTTEISIETGAGVLPLVMYPNAREHIDKVRVNMGPPRLARADLPMLGPADEQVINMPLKVLDREFEITCVSMGNPHCVIFVDKLEDFPVRRYGYAIENHELFPNRVNVEFVEIISRNEVKQRTWERGAGETLACGTGSSAVTVAGVLTDRTDGTLLNHLTGGDLEMEWDGKNEVFMTGPAAEVFSGEYVPR